VERDDVATLCCHVVPCQPSPNKRRVGFHIKPFEACSAFTHIAACLLAGRPKAIRFIEGSGGFVASTAASTATGWSAQLPDGIRTRWRSAAFSRRTFVEVLPSEGGRMMYG
jgi:hypothetical protein